MAKFDFQGKLYEKGRRVITGVIEEIRDDSGNSVGKLNVTTNQEGNSCLSIKLNPPKGDPGEKGDLPTITIKKVATFAAGRSAKVIAEESSDGKGYELSFGIPRGQQGDPGEPGKQGETGLPGRTPKVAVDPVIETIGPNETPYVEDLDRDDPYNATWKFHLPKGDKGDPAQITKVNIEALDPNEKARATITTKYNAETETNESTLSLWIPKGEKGDLFNGTLEVGRGGTGITTAPSMLVKLSSEEPVNIFTESPQPGVVGTLPISHGGTGVELTTTPSMLVKLNSEEPAEVFTESPQPGVVGTLPISHGGTGVTANPSMLVNLGSTTSANVFAKSPHPGVGGTLPVNHGGTGVTATPIMLVKLDSEESVSIFTESPKPGIEGTLPISHGGTGVELTTPPSMLVKLNSTTPADIFSKSPRPGVDGVLPISHGGTGLPTPPVMRVNLGATTSANVFREFPKPGIEGTLSVAHGGTGATTTADARLSLGIDQAIEEEVDEVIVISNTKPTSDKTKIWIRTN